MDQDKIVEQFIEVKLPSRDTFLKVVETLTRIGVASRHENKLYQSVHLLCKYKTRYFLCSFKHLFQLDGKSTDITDNDIARLNTIANLLESWGLVEIINPEKTKTNVVPLSQIKIIAHKDKANWELIPKYTIGNKNKTRQRTSNVTINNDDDRWNR